MSVKQGQQAGFGGWSADPNDVVNAASATVEKWPKALTELVDVVEDAVKRECSVDTATALQIAQVAISSIAVYHGGRGFYLPSGKKLHDALRDQQIWKGHNGRNVLALARQYGITESMVYKIIAEQRSLHMTRIQPGLF